MVKPALRKTGAAQVPAGAPHAQVHDAVFLQARKLMCVPAHHHRHMIFAQQLVERELALELQRNQPHRRAVEEDKLWIAGTIPFQVLLQELHLVLAEILRAAVVEDGEMRIPIIEAV